MFCLNTFVGRIIMGDLNGSVGYLSRITFQYFVNMSFCVRAIVTLYCPEPEYDVGTDAQNVIELINQWLHFVC